MIRKYRFGNPLNTEAVVKEYPIEKGEIPCIEVKEGEKISFIMTKGAPVYGLGNRSGVLTKEAGSIPATVPTIPTTGRIPIPSMPPIISWSSLRQNLSVSSWTIREKLPLTRLHPAGYSCDHHGQLGYGSVLY